MKIKKVKVVQVFLQGDGAAEISAKMLAVKISDGTAAVSYEEDDGQKCMTIFSLANLRMIRIFEEDE